MNRVILFFVTSLIALVLGWGVGSYITYNNTVEAMGKIPASPLIVKSVYDKGEHSVVFSFYNPGTLPLTITSESFIFKPGKETKQKGYEMANIPAHIVLPPMTITLVSLKLKKGTEKLKLGDVVMATLHYVHPLSTDVYTISHRFELGGKNDTFKGKKEGEKK